MLNNVHFSLEASEAVLIESLRGWYMAGMNVTPLSLMCLQWCAAQRRNNHIISIRIGNVNQWAVREDSCGKVVHSTNILLNLNSLVTSKLLSCYQSRFVRERMCKMFRMAVASSTENTVTLHPYGPAPPIPLKWRLVSWRTTEVLINLWTRLLYPSSCPCQRSQSLWGALSNVVDGVSAMTSRSSGVVPQIESGRALWGTWMQIEQKQGALSAFVIAVTCRFRRP